MQHSWEFPVKFFATGGSNKLAKKVVERLKKKNMLCQSYRPEKGLMLNYHEVERFSNNEFRVKPESVRGYSVVIIHTRKTESVHAGLFELFQLVDALINAGVWPHHILITFSYLPYSRSNKKDASRVSAMGPSIAKFLNLVYKVTKVLLVEPHADDCCKDFYPWAKHVSTNYLFMHFIKKQILSRYNKKDLIFAFPDAGAVKRYAEIANQLSIPYVNVDKNRKGGVSFNNRVVEEVKSKICLLMDDEISSGETVVKSSRLFKKSGARSIVVFATHGAFNHKERDIREQMDYLEKSSVDRFVITDTIPVWDKIKKREKFTLLTVSGLLASVIKDMTEGVSLSPTWEYKRTEEYYISPKVPTGDL